MAQSTVLTRDLALNSADSPWDSESIQVIESLIDALHLAITLNRAIGEYSPLLA